MSEECIKSWKKFSSYIPLSFLVKDSLEKIIPALPETINVADIGGGNPTNPRSSSYLLSQILEKYQKNYSLDVYDLNGEDPKNDKIRFISGDLNKTINLDAGYDFAISINVLQTPSIPCNFSNKIYKSMKPGTYLVLLLPGKKMNEVELFQQIESLVKQYPDGVIERRYDRKMLIENFPKNSWTIEELAGMSITMPLDKKALDNYFIVPLVKDKAKKLVKEFVAKDDENIYMKSKLNEYFDIKEESEFKPILLQSSFIKVLAKRI